jgi:hypothetical protein
LEEAVLELEKLQVVVEAVVEAEVQLEALHHRLEAVEAAAEEDLLAEI